MKPLAQMTKDELWSLDDYDIWELYYLHFRITDEESPLSTDEAREQLEQRRIELQQDSADARRKSLEDR